MAEIWLTILAAGVLTYLTRLSFIFLLDRWQLPANLQRALRFVPPAVLSAIIFPELLIQNSQPVLTLANPRLLAGIVTTLVAWRSRSILFSIAAGLISFYLLRLLF